MPWDKPLLLLPNHQNALLDPLILAAYLPIKPYFLTRSDVFVHPVLNAILGFFRMLPIYRLRDGRHTLTGNQVIFRRCADLLCESQAILVFPEANHKLERRVRPLSKGFTRILFAALDQCPDQEVFLLPVGVNYENAAGFPDSVSFYFGNPIGGSDYYGELEEREAAMRTRAVVSASLRQLTTHVPQDQDYTAAIALLQSEGVSFLDPSETNRLLRRRVRMAAEGKISGHKSLLQGILDMIFLFVNLPWVGIWRGLIKPRIPEPEFLSTHRFLFAVVAYPVGYVVLGYFLLLLIGLVPAIIIVLGHFILNLLYVKWR